MAFWFFLLLAIASLSTVHAQLPTTDGYVSIDCGISSNTNYTDETTNIPYVSDDGFIDTGTDHTIASNYVDSSLEKQLQTLRSFPNGSRNCYALTVTPEQKYLVRASFMYGSYDGLNGASPSNPLLFDLHLGVNLWTTVNITKASDVHRAEAIFVASADSASVCLVKTGSATPFISALELRPLKNTIYPYANATQNLVLFLRINLAPTTNHLLRYPFDRYDRIWLPFVAAAGWTSISTNLTVKNYAKDQFEAPSAVMQTAAVPVNASMLEFSWDFVGSGAPVNEFYANLHFSELLPNTSRAFDVYINDDKWFANYTPPYLMSGAIYSTTPLYPSLRYNWALNSSGLSTLPPILNALEVYTPMFFKNTPTDSDDVDAIINIRVQYQLKRNWMGDPCSPKEYAWDGLKCSYDLNSPRITDVNLSASALTGPISSSFAKLTAIKYLDLSYNNLTGPLPDVLGNLPSLQVLNLAGNNLSGPIPASLLKRSQQGLLILRTEGNQNLCASGNSCEIKTDTESKKKKIATPIIVIICLVPVVLFLVAIFIFCRMRKSKGSANILVQPEKERLSNLVKGHQDNPLQLDNRQFTYTEVLRITNNFERTLGKGGFGTVYHGYLEDGTQVAVKTRSQSSSQGTKEFLAEVQHLIRIHHKSLVSLVGYCMDGDHLALVYEYMSQGTLLDYIRGKTRNASAFSWGKRLQIAIEAAQGLEYLHKGCKPPLIHRDVKTANILLSEQLEAKIADFGLSKAIQNDVTNVPTAVVGTPGYLDPDYYISGQLSEKSDVYGFGVILLELITAEPPILIGRQNAHIVQRVRERLANGNIEDVVDSKLQGEYDVNSVWKVADIAFRCTAQASHQRPTMTEVVAELKESLALECPRDTMGNSNIYAETNEASQNTAIEMERFVEFSPSAR
ncbi:putative leucine-rich repeat receptor-like protein kinase At2g19210 [Musa acuminata AAA Group]|uniref:putative leucine-rich repeat receptor-like protein kinase At2g19210 n=1 Tax=Musa acuminata AAA Group TaxID=214697 RepID=UPI0031CFB81A